VLIVDDEPELVELLAVAVAEAVWQPFRAADGYGALRIARECEPHVVFLDRMLPDLDGPSVLRRLRNQSDSRHGRILGHHPPVTPGAATSGPHLRTLTTRCRRPRT